MIIDDILNVFQDTQSIRQTAKETSCSWQRVVKVLASKGVVINGSHEIILKLHEEGKTPGEIARQIGYSEKVVRAYLPKKRPYYGVNISENAKRIKRCRENKKN
ncbi:MAG: hypothetical protein HFG42_16235 [Lachnospiraceae bacterium]|jgi:DNA-binding NarL/FixJ family response regulator|nr:hypothetical protein [Lachnospiraceae bacterium]